MVLLAHVAGSGGIRLAGGSTFALVVLLSCQSLAGVGGRKQIAGIKSWGYQLEGEKDGAYNLDALAKSPFDLLVIDYADHGRPFARSQVEALKRKPGGGSRLVVAYMSIGEAETYRYYWPPGWKKNPPAFLGPANPDWPDNHKVRYWMPAWQKIIFGVPSGESESYLDRIVDAGFDGVYLDIVDAFEFFGPDGQIKENESAAPDMARFVVALARYAREERQQKDFVVIPQNGPALIDSIEAAAAKEYLAAIDAIGAEDTFFYGDAPEDNPFKVQRDALGFLKRFLAAGKVVLAVEYLSDAKKARRFVRLAREYGFVPYVGRRDLDRLVQQPE
jgi:cysteinyl-tRNA synthetase